MKKIIMGSKSSINKADIEQIIEAIRGNEKHKLKGIFTQHASPKKKQYRKPSKY